MIISKISGLNDTAFGKIEAPVKSYLTDADLLAKQGSQLEQIFPVVVSTNFGEAYAGQTGLTNYTAGGEASRYPDNTFQDDFNKIVTNDTEWKNQFPITLAMIEDGKFGAIKDEATKLVDAYYNTLEEYGGDFLTKAIGTTQTFGGKTFDIAGGDAKALFATNHQSKVATAAGGYAAQSNLYNLEFSYTNLTKAEVLLGNQRDSIGRKLKIQPDTILVPYSTIADSTQLQLVFEALNAEGNPGTADRAGNFHSGRWNIIWWPFLGEPTGKTEGKSWWMLMDSKYVEKYRPFVLQKRKDLTISSYVDDNTDNNIWKGRSRTTIDVTNNWRGIIACIPGLGTTVS